MFRARPRGHPQAIPSWWSSSGLPGSWRVPPVPLPCSRDPGRAPLPCHSSKTVLPPQVRPRRPQQSCNFRGSFTRLQYSLSTLPDSDFPTLARLASGGWQPLPGGIRTHWTPSANFKRGFTSRLFQRPRLRLAPPTAYCLRIRDSKDVTTYGSGLDTATDFAV